MTSNIMTSSKLYLVSGYQVNFSTGRCRRVGHIKCRGCRGFQLFTPHPGGHPSFTCSIFKRPHRHAPCSQSHPAWDGWGRSPPLSGCQSTGPTPAVAQSTMRTARTALGKRAASSESRCVGRRLNHQLEATKVYVRLMARALTSGRTTR